MDEYDGRDHGHSAMVLFDWFYDSAVTQSMSRGAFNQLRRCIGEPTVGESVWQAALLEVAEPHPQLGVSRTSFVPLLFWPPPCFGKEEGEDIQSTVTTSVRHCLSAQAIVEMFGQVVDVNGRKLIGLGDLQRLQGVLNVGVRISEAQWSDVMGISDTPVSGMDWKVLAEACAGSTLRSKILGSVDEDLEIVVSMLRNGQSSDHEDAHEARDGHKVDPMATASNMREECDLKPTKSLELKPKVVRTNTRHQVLSYEISFEDTRDIGIGLEPGFDGHCLIVTSLRGQAAEYGDVIMLGDIVTMVRDISVNLDGAASDTEGSSSYSSLLQPKGGDQCTICFERPASTFGYNSTMKQLTLTWKVSSDLKSNDKTIITLPTSSSSYSRADGNIPLTGTWTTRPQDKADVKEATVRLSPTSRSIVVTRMSAPTNSTINLCIDGIACSGAQGPTYSVTGVADIHDDTFASEEDEVHVVRLRSDWRVLQNYTKMSWGLEHEHEHTFERICFDFRPDEHEFGLTNVPCFGPWAVVNSVVKLPQDKASDIEPLDIISAITTINPEGRPLSVIDCLKPTSSSQHASEVSMCIDGASTLGAHCQLSVLRPRVYLSFENERCAFILRTPWRPQRGCIVVRIRLPKKSSAGDLAWQTSTQLQANVVGVQHDFDVKGVAWNSSEDAVDITLCAASDVTIAPSSKIVISIQGLKRSTTRAQALENMKTSVSFLGKCISQRLRTNNSEFREFKPSKPHEVLALLDCTLYESFTSLPYSCWDQDASVELELLSTGDSVEADTHEAADESIALLFDKYASGGDFVALADINHLVCILKGDAKRLDESEWLTQCLELGADSEVGWDSHQFAKWWCAERHAKETLEELQRAESLFELFKRAYAADTGLLPLESLSLIMRALQISEIMRLEVINDLVSTSVPGWDCDTFSQVVLGTHPRLRNVGTQVDTGDAPVLRLWNYFQDAQSLFDEYCGRGSKAIDRLGFEHLIVTRTSQMSSTLTNDEWVSICAGATLEGGDKRASEPGLTLPMFLAVCADFKLAFRKDALHKWSPVRTLTDDMVFAAAAEDGDTFTVATDKNDRSATPERVNVAEVAFQVLAQTPSPDDAMQDLMVENLEFGETAFDGQADGQTWETSFTAQRLERSEGMLRISVKSITELAERDVRKGADASRLSSFGVENDVVNRQLFSKVMDAKEGTSDKVGDREELFVVFEITDSQGVKKYVHDKDKVGQIGVSQLAKQLLFGRKPDTDITRAVKDVWDGGKSQTLIRQCVASMAVNGVRDISSWNLSSVKQVHSSLIPASEVRESVLRFPNDHFCLHVAKNDDAAGGEENLKRYVVCRLFERTAADDGRADELAAELAAEAANLEALRSSLNARRDHGDTTAQEDAEVNRNIDSCRARIKQLQEDITTVRAQTKFIGQASFDLDSLLGVLDGDSRFVEDVAPIRSEDKHDVGVLLAKFQFLCDHSSYSDSAVADTELPSLQVCYESDDKDDMYDGGYEGSAYEYPATSPLQIAWRMNGSLERGDQLYLVREDLEAKFSSPFFILLWWKINITDCEESGEWWAPNSCRAALASTRAAYGEELQGHQSVDAAVRESRGQVRLPSSFALSLPPGVYRVYLVRRPQDTDIKTRAVLGRTALLAVVPGVNSVHTCFGTTPLVDVRAVNASLHSSAGDVRLAAHSNVASGNVAPRSVDENYIRDVRTIDQELEVAKLDLEEASNEASELSQVPPALKVKIAQLSKIMQELEEEKGRLSNETSSDSLRRLGTPHARVYTTSKTLASGLQATFDFQIEGGKPLAGDSIVVMPAAVARTADLLRASILGKLQENDPRKLAEIRSTLETRLQKVKYRLDVYRNRFSPRKWTWWGQPNRLRQPEFWWTARSLIPRIGAVAVLSDEPSEGPCWVLQECRRAFTEARPVAQHAFPYIITELITEIRARRAALGITTATGEADTSASVLDGSGKTSKSIILEIPINPDARQITAADETHAEVATGAVSKMLHPSIFWNGGEYIAKYIRRPTASGNQAVETAGELGRCGPFVVEKQNMDFTRIMLLSFTLVWSAVVFVVLSVVGCAVSGATKEAMRRPYSEFKVFAEQSMKSARRVFVSRQLRFVVKFLLYLFFTFLKYSLAVVSLSVNIALVSRDFNFRLDQYSPISLDRLLSRYRGLLDWSVWKFIAWIKLDGIVRWISDKLEFLDLTKYLAKHECVSGFAMYVFLIKVVAAAFLLYVVVRADLLLKVQKWHVMIDLPMNKTTLAFCEQVGTLFVTPVYLFIKTAVVFMSTSLAGFFEYIHHKPLSTTLADLQLSMTSTFNCPNATLAKANMFAGVVALVLVAIFVFVCIPLIALDLYAWVPLPLPRKRKQAAKATRGYKNTKHTFKGIEKALHEGEFLVQWDISHRISSTVSTFPFVGPKWRRLALALKVAHKRLVGKLLALLPEYLRRVLLHPMFQSYDDVYEDFYSFSREKIIAKYGLVGAAWLCFRVYFHMMFQTIVRAIGDLVAWRYSHEDMYETKQQQPTSRRWRNRVNQLCCSFNWRWKAAFFKNRIVLPLYNVICISMGVWTDHQYQTFQVEERANEAFSMEPSGEARQLQLMAVQGKVVSLFWLCFPRAAFVSIFAEIFNLGPLLTYVVNSNFLQADTLETERVEKPTMRLSKVFAKRPSTDVLYLFDDTTLFATTSLKWASAISQLTTLFLVYPPSLVEPRSAYKALVVAAAVTPVLELNRALISMYLEYIEEIDTTDASLVGSTDSSDAHRDNDTADSNAIDKENIFDEDYKTNKDLIRLEALPRISYVVIANALDEHKGKLTISWQVNANRRFNKRDAIGMFHARAPGDTTRRTMDDCICYRLLEEPHVEQFGWKTNRKSVSCESGITASNHRVHLLDLEAIPRSSDQNHDELSEIAVVIQATEDLSGTGDPHRSVLAPRISKAKNSKGPSKISHAAREACKIVHGQVMFRPVNNCVAEDDGHFERFSHGNGAGIYNAKYGLHAYEFCYLRYFDYAKSTNDRRSAKIKKDSASMVQPDVKGHYDVLSQYLSNPIQIGTFNMFMSLTCAQPLVKTSGRLDLSWTINGVPYSVLSNPKSRNCIGFFKVSDSANASSASATQHCARIELLPSSAFHEASDDKPCAGRVTVTTPREPGLYEVRFLLNYFQSSQLHRLCQVFGDLEDEMQQLRIHALYDRRIVVDALQAFASQERLAWCDAHAATRAWLSSLLMSTLRESGNCRHASSKMKVKRTIKLVGDVKTKLTISQKTKSAEYAHKLADMMAPLRHTSFQKVLLAAYDSNSQLRDQLSSVTFISPSAEDKKTRNSERNQLFVPRSDRNIRWFGDFVFEYEAETYLRTPSLCGFGDFLDDILLNHELLLANLHQISTTVAGTCVSLYEDAILGALRDVEAEASKRGMAETLADARMMLMHTSMNHVESMILAFLQTDERTGHAWPGPFDDLINKLAVLRAGTTVKKVNTTTSTKLGTSSTTVVDQAILTPRTPQYLALRKWAYPRLTRKIVNLLRVRHSRIVQGTWPCVKQLIMKSFAILMIVCGFGIRARKDDPGPTTTADTCPGSQQIQRVEHPPQARATVGHSQQ